MSVDATFTAVLVDAPTAFRSAYGKLATRIHEPAVILTATDGQQFGMPRATFDALFPAAGINPDDLTFDDAPFTLDTALPADEATGVDIAADIVLTFSKDVRASTVNATNIVITADAVAKEGTFTVDGAEVTFNPTEDFAVDDVVEVTITTDVTDLYGLSLAEEAVIGFTVEAA